MAAMLFSSNVVRRLVADGAVVDALQMQDLGRCHRVLRPSVHGREIGVLWGFRLPIL